MDAEMARKTMLALPHVVETMQWGENLVFWAGDKAIGGKMFALINLDVDPKFRGVISYAAGAERYADLLEVDGLLPAPYFARIFWVAAGSWSAHRNAVWQQELRSAYELTLNKLAPATRRLLALPASEQKRLIVERTKEKANERTKLQAEEGPEKVTAKSTKTPKKKAAAKKRAGKPAANKAAVEKGTR